MGKISETGHVINISNFKLMIDICKEFGAVYNPSNANLTIVNMTTLWVTADTSHQALTAAVQNSKEPINQREILFKPAGKLVTRTLNYFESTNASDEIKKDAKELADRFRGFKVKKLPGEQLKPSGVSKSHLSYVMKADTFRQLVDLYNSDVNYAPNETDLSVADLTALWNNMKSLNDNIGTILAPVENARIARNKALYDEGTGMIDVALACKKYVRGAFGKTSPEAKLIGSIKFTRKRY